MIARSLMSASDRVPAVSAEPSWLVFYDADCGFCRWALAGVLRWDRAGDCARSHSNVRRRMSCWLSSHVKSACAPGTWSHRLECATPPARPCHRCCACFRGVRCPPWVWRWPRARPIGATAGLLSIGPGYRGGCPPAPSAAPASTWPAARLDHGRSQSTDSLQANSLRNRPGTDTRFQVGCNLLPSRTRFA